MFCLRPFVLLTVALIDYLAVIIALPLVVVGHWVAVLVLYRWLGEAPAVAYFFFAPLAQFVVYKSLPSDLAFVQSTWALAASFFRRRDSHALIRERTQLKEDTRALIDRLAWGMQVRPPGRLPPPFSALNPHSLSLLL